MKKEGQKKIQREIDKASDELRKLDYPDYGVEVEVGIKDTMRLPYSSFPKRLKDVRRNRRPMKWPITPMRRSRGPL